jgi:hypothetical protein
LMQVIVQTSAFRVSSSIACNAVRWVMLGSPLA